MDHVSRDRYTLSKGFIDREKNNFLAVFAKTMMINFIIDMIKLKNVIDYNFGEQTHWKNYQHLSKRRFFNNPAKTKTIKGHGTKARAWLVSKSPFTRSLQT